MDSSPARGSPMGSRLPATASCAPRPPGALRPRPRPAVPVFRSRPWAHRCCTGPESRCQLARRGPAAPRRRQAPRPPFYPERSCAGRHGVLRQHEACPCLSPVRRRPREGATAAAQKARHDDASPARSRRRETAVPAGRCAAWHDGLAGNRGRSVEAAGLRREPADLPSRWSRDAPGFGRIHGRTQPPNASRTVGRSDVRAQAGGPRGAEGELDTGAASGWCNPPSTASDRTGRRAGRPGPQDRGSAQRLVRTSGRHLGAPSRPDPRGVQPGTVGWRRQPR